MTNEARVLPAFGFLKRTALAWKELRAAGIDIIFASHVSTYAVVMAQPVPLPGLAGRCNRTARSCLLRG
jgi:hypothetical protein